MRADISEWEAWERDVGLVADDIAEKLPPILKKAGVNIKGDWSSAWGGHKRFRHLRRAINFDVKTDPGGGSVEVGPDLGRKQGPLGGVAAYGTPTSAPIPGMNEAMDKEEPRLIDQVQQLLGRRLDGDGR